MRTDAHLRTDTQGGGRGFPPSSFRLGNDVVDLRHPSCRDREPGDRLLERVLTPAEREWLGSVAAAGSVASAPIRAERPSSSRHASASPDSWLVALWALWAAKETAFKVVSKMTGVPEVFRHQGFESSLEVVRGECSGMVRIRGVVRGAEVPGRVEVEGSSDGEHVHLVGWAGDAVSGERSAGLPAPTLEVGLEASADRPGDLEGFRSHFTEFEWAGINTVPAAEARLRARARLEAYLARAPQGSGPGGRQHHPSSSSGAPSPVEIITSGERPGRTPPRIRVDGSDRPDLDVSLSHHGRFVAWALLVPTPGSAPPSP